MFTIKKLALIGAAGLAALSISCSDTVDSEGGSWTTEFGATFDNTAKTIGLVGVIAAESGNITQITLTAGGLTTVFSGKGFDTNPLAVNAPSFDFEGVYAGIQTICGTATGQKSVEVKAKVEFDSGDPSEKATSVNVTCGSGSGTPLVKKNLTLSFQGSSYADIDGTNPTLYGQRDVTGSVATAKKIDLIAYATSGAANEIYAPGGVELAIDGAEDYFYDVVYDDPEELMGILFFPLPSTAVNIIGPATDLADLTDWLGGLSAYVQATEPVYSVAATPGTGFLAFTSESKLVAVLITGGGTAATVDLGITGGIGN